MIRNVTIKDAGQIAAIYNYYISETTSTLEIDPIDPKEIESRIKKVTSNEKLPYLVYEENDKILGFAYATIWRQRVGYRYCVESSVYVKNGIFQKKVGSKLYLELIDRLKHQKYKSVIGVLTLPNNASANFHEKMGFEKVGFFKEVGHKFNEWHDVGFWMLKL